MKPIPRIAWPIAYHGPFVTDLRLIVRRNPPAFWGRPRRADDWTADRFMGAGWYRQAWTRETRGTRPLYAAADADLTDDELDD